MHFSTYPAYSMFHRFILSTEKSQKADGVFQKMLFISNTYEKLWHDEKYAGVQCRT